MYYIYYIRRFILYYIINNPAWWQKTQPSRFSEFELHYRSICFPHRKTQLQAYQSTLRDSDLRVFFGLRCNGVGAAWFVSKLLIQPLQMILASPMVLNLALVILTLMIHHQTILKIPGKKHANASVPLQAVNLRVWQTLLFQRHLVSHWASFTWWTMVMLGRMSLILPSRVRILLGSKRSWNIISVAKEIANGYCPSNLWCIWLPSSGVCRKLPKIVFCGLCNKEALKSSIPMIAPLQALAVTKYLGLLKAC